MRALHLLCLVGVSDAYSPLYTFGQRQCTTSSYAHRRVSHSTTSWKNNLTSLQMSGESSTTTIDSIDRTTTTLPSATKPLSHPGTFAGQVEQALVSKFDETKIQRVIQSWRLLEMDYEHREFVGNQQSPPILEDIDEKTSKYYQHAPSYVPGLKAVAWWDNVDELDWAKSLSKSYNAIREEFLNVMANPDKLQLEGNNIWAGAITDDATSYGVSTDTDVYIICCSIECCI